MSETTNGGQKSVKQRGIDSSTKIHTWKQVSLKQIHKSD
jgi:hypothetical protein